MFTASEPGKFVKKKNIFKFMINMTESVLSSISYACFFLSRSSFYFVGLLMF